MHVATEIQIDPEFQSLIPPLTPEEYNQLEINIITEGCRDALVVWNGILVDGHNRYQICTKHGLEYKTTELYRDTREDVKAWIIQNQFGRRNLTPYQRAELALLLEPVFREKAKEKKQEAGGAVPQKSVKPPVDTQKELAKVAGVSHDTISKAKKISEQGDAETKDLLRKGEISINQAYRNLEREQKKEEQKQRRLEPVELPKGEYDVIYADPPWQYNFAPHKDGMSIEEHYDTMTVDQICDMDIPSAKNAVLFMWATAPKLKEAMRVMEAWGFEYKTNAVWDKVKVAGRGAWKSGYWFYGRHELLLVGTKGQFSPPLEDVRQESVITEPRTKHSKKPECIYEIIESYFPNHTRIELFARQTREGWASYGNEI